MSGFFDSVKKSLGLSKDKSTARDVDLSLPFHEFEVTFTEEKLGIGISKHTGEMPHLSGLPEQGAAERSCPQVTNFDARKYDVQPGDLIVALEGNPISSFDDFTSIIKAIGRPVRIRFLRRRDATIKASAAPAGATVSNNSAPAGASGGAGSSAMSSMNPMKLLGSMTGTSASSAAAAAKAKPAVLTEEEKRERREKLSAAAQDRSQTWDRKLGQKKPSSGAGMASLANPEDVAASGVPVSAETERAIRKTKELEMAIEKQLGYSPFRPHMSFKSSTSAVGNSIGSSAAVGGAAAPVPALTAADLAAQDSAGAEELAAEEAQVEGEVDDALAMLLSLGEADQEVGRVAVSTVQKMLLNLHSNPGEQKLRSIRVSNKAFQSKVAAVPGGVELLLAAGYAYSGGGGDAATSTAAEGQTTAPEAGSGAAESSVQELFLVHRMDGPGARRLGYTLYRVQELLAAVNGGDSSPVGNGAASPRPAT